MPRAPWTYSQVIGFVFVACYTTARCGLYMVFQYGSVIDHGTCRIEYRIHLRSAAKTIEQRSQDHRDHLRTEHSHRPVNPRHIDQGEQEQTYTEGRRP